MDSRTPVHPSVRPARGRVLLALLAFALLLLPACAPTAEDEERAAVEQLSEPVTFYPHQAGLRWQYLPDGAALSEPRAVHLVEGPSVLDGRVWTGERMAGRGLDLRWFREYDADGVELRREVRPGTIIDFDPPLREFPAPSELRVGASWSGESHARVTFPDATPENRLQEVDFRYSYIVVDRRPVTLPAGTFDAYVIAFTSETTDELGRTVEEVQRELWFVPYVGVVRDVRDQILVASNAFEAPQAE